MNYQQKIDALTQLTPGCVTAALQQSLTGIEKEALRVSPQGALSQNPHPTSLGSTLMHPWITTDYSEAMLELITPPLQGIDATLAFLRNIHSYVYQKLRAKKELLWATSMPCVLAGETHIPIARYGKSNPGLMKHIYRVGLGSRYGRVMQVISGVHFNFSFAESFWDLYAQVQEVNDNNRHFRDQHYMHMIRNIQRFGWIIPYLFGASPAVCRSFFKDHDPYHFLAKFDSSTYYLPYATSLRMSDIGYQNQKEGEVGIKANYDSIQSYVASLTDAISTSAPPWEKIGVRDTSDRYLQLNTNILQIENEYYSTVRPKQNLNYLEMPSVALSQRGISYVELRSLDVNAFDPLGINHEQLAFLQVFLLFCLLQESPRISDAERVQIDANLLATARNGRAPDCMLSKNGKAILLQDWGKEVLDAMRPVARLWDGAETGSCASAVAAQLQKIIQPDLTPSAQMLRTMRSADETFSAFAQAQSYEHLHFFEDQHLTPAELARFEQETQLSLANLAQIEARQEESFEVFLEKYFAQIKKVDVSAIKDASNHQGVE
jgi:glutamate--cysteine ligase